MLTVKSDRNVSFGHTTDINHGTERVALAGVIPLLRQILQLIWRSDTSKIYLRILDPQMNDCGLRRVGV